MCLSMLILSLSHWMSFYMYFFHSLHLVSAQKCSFGFVLFSLFFFFFLLYCRKTSKWNVNEIVSMSVYIYFLFDCVRTAILMNILCVCFRFLHQIVAKIHFVLQLAMLVFCLCSRSDALLIGVQSFFGMFCSSSIAKFASKVRAENVFAKWPFLYWFLE